MVVVGALAGRGDAADALVLRAIATGDVRLAVSDEGYMELSTVLSYEEVKARITDPVRAFEIALDIGTMGILYHPRKYDWRIMPDPKDRWLLDLAFESRADHIVTRDRHFLDIESDLAELGFAVLTPPDLLRGLADESR